MQLVETKGSISIKPELFKTWKILRNYYFKGRFTRSNFWSQLLLKFKEVNDANQHFYETVMSWNKARRIIGCKNGSCEPTLREACEKAVSPKDFLIE